MTRRLSHRLLLLLGSLGPVGHLPASGTAAVALVGVPLFVLVRVLEVSTPIYMAGTVAFTLLAVWVHHVGDKLLGEKDSRKLVLDELAGFAVAMIGVPCAWPVIVLGFLLERGLDIAKVPPANWIERRWPGGWGVVCDDLVAGVYTCLLLHAAMRYLPSLAGH